MKGFSKGNWRVTEPGERDGHYMVWSGKRLVAVVHGDGMAHDNAKLISSAPDLLKFALEFKSNIDSWLKTGEPANPKESKRIYELAEKAINKAL